ncbi:MAG: hypothetical protein LBJ80_03455 [Rickettsiales bacterium]|jgi:hypothetical protein|nr:hypothetical protein [Rickettsiales bacterium]MDR1261450.1 hypothetical protein [Rickettsiales bacterium]
MVEKQTSQAVTKESTGPSIQLTNEDKKTFEKKEHQLIYRAFLDTLENPEKQTRQEMEKIAKELQKKLSEEQKQKLLDNRKSLEELVPRLQNENEKKIFTFAFENSKDIFKNVDPEDIKSLSEENFLQFLISVFEKIREKNLASKENLENGEIGKIVKECVDNIRSTEAKDSLIKLAGWPLGIKVDPKNISGSFMSGLKEKVPFLGGGKEKDEPPLSDEEMVTTFLRKIFLPTLFSIASILVFGPTTFAIVAAAIGTIFAVKGGVGVLFSNNRKGTLYNPDTEKKKEWGGEISRRISEILETPVKGAGKDKQPAVTPGEQLTQGRENNEQPNAALGQVNVDQPNESKSPVNTPNL